MARKQWADILYTYVKSNRMCTTSEVYEYCYDNWPKTTPMRTSIGTLLSQDKRVRNINKGMKNAKAEWIAITTFVKQDKQD